jgi:hypothetical protein
MQHGEWEGTAITVTVEREADAAAQRYGDDLFRAMLDAEPDPSRQNT